MESVVLPYQRRKRSAGLEFCWKVERRDVVLESRVWRCWWRVKIAVLCCVLGGGWAGFNDSTGRRIAS